MTFIEAFEIILTDTKLTPSAKIVLLKLFARQGKNEIAWPSIKTLCRDCGLTNKSIIRATKELESKRKLTVFRSDHPSIGNSNQYTVTLTSGETPQEPMEKLHYPSGETPQEPMEKLHSNSTVNNTLNNKTNNTSENCVFPETKTDVPTTGDESIRVGFEDKKPKSKSRKNKLPKEVNTIFQEFYDLYPGDKSKVNFEFMLFKKNNEDWEDCLKLLKPAVEHEISHKKELRVLGKFCPEWKSMTSWLYKQSWGQVLSGIEEEPMPYGYVPKSGKEAEEMSDWVAREIKAEDEAEAARRLKQEQQA